MCPEKAAKTRIALIKAHGLQMVKSLQSSAEQTSGCMQQWLKEHNLAEMRRYNETRLLCARLRIICLVGQMMCLFCDRFMSNPLLVNEVTVDT